MNTSIRRIKSDFDAFCQRVESYREHCANHILQKDSCEAAYEGLYRLNQRIKKELESGDLNTQQRRICHGLLEDKFLNGLLELRTVSAHIESDSAKKRGYIQIYVPSGQPVNFSCEVSAGALFSNNIFMTSESHSDSNKINHMDNLKTAVKRIGDKLSSNT
jgi:hypothetical protein